MVPSKEMVSTIQKILDEKGLGVKQMKQFGSSLEPDRFDLLGEGRSDLDFLAVVQGTYNLERNDRLPEFFLELYRPELKRFAYRHYPIPETENWDNGRQIHLLIVPHWWAEDVKKLPLHNSGEYGNAFTKALLTGKKLFPEET